VSSPSGAPAANTIWRIFRSTNASVGYHTKMIMVTSAELLKLKKIYLLPNWCLGTLMRVSDKEEKVPRLLALRA